MECRTIESLGTEGRLIDPALRLDPDVENITLIWEEPDREITLTDSNIDYTSLPINIGVDSVKKTFLTYNGCDTATDTILETVVYESNSGPDPTASGEPGYNDSNFWTYKPSEFRVPTKYLTMTNPYDYSNLPYDYSQGFTVVKTFLTSTGSYTGFYRAPQLTTFKVANVESNKVYTDGWYTSYTLAVMKYSAWIAALSASPSLIPTTAEGYILFDDAIDLTTGLPANEFYINITGTYTPGLDPVNDPTNWRANPTFAEWQDFLRGQISAQYAFSPVYFSETQHLVTPDLGDAIEVETLKIAKECCNKDFNLPHVKNWIKLKQKREAACISLNLEDFKEMQCIIEGTRKLCNDCLYLDSCSC